MKKASHKKTIVEETRAATFRAKGAISETTSRKSRILEEPTAFIHEAPSAYRVARTGAAKSTAAGQSEEMQGFDDQGNALPPSAIVDRELPAGWRWVRVNEVGHVQLGRQRAPQHHTGSHMRPYLRVANVYEDRFDLSDVLEMNFTPAEFKTFELRPGDILLNEGQSLHAVGRPALYRGEVPGACFQNTLVRFRCGPLVAPKFALTIFRGYMHTGKFQKIARWTTNIAHLGASRFAQLPFPLPPIEEQGRIVAEVEKQLTRLEAGVASLKRARVGLKRYRASVLKTACEGLLVPTNLEWKEGVLGDVLTGIDAGKSFKCEERPPGDGEIGVVKVSAVTWGVYNEQETKTCLDAERVETRYFVKQGDFLFSRANTIELVGACLIVHSVSKHVMLSDKILRFHFADSVLPEWVLIWLRSEFGRREIERLSTGNQESMRNIGQERIRHIPLRIPPLAQQRRIVAEVGRRMSVIDELDRAVAVNLKRVTRLRRSILHSSFTGALLSI